MPLEASEGVLCVAHGTVEDLGDLPEFLLRIRHGRPAPAELVRELERRYQAIGGSPLLAITRRQAQALGESLGMPAWVGMRLWEPGVEQALRAAAERGIGRLYLVPLAPFSVAVYREAAERSLEKVRTELGSCVPELRCVKPWGTNPGFVRVLADWIVRSRPLEDEALILSAHSLPLRVIQAGDPYASEVEACAEAVGRALGREVHLAYQSQGANGGSWLGPDLRDVFSRLEGRGAKRALIAPFGFLAEHVETLYDLDIEAPSWAREHGIALRRVPALNEDSGLIEVLAELVRSAQA